MKRQQFFPLAAIILAMLVSGPFVAGAWGADVRDGAFEVGAFGGLYLMEGNQWVGDSPVFGGRLGYFLWRDLSFEFSFSYLPAEYDIDGTKYNNATVGFPAFQASGSAIDWYQFRFEFLYHLEEVYDRFVPFFGMGAGLVLLDSGAIDNKLDTQITAGLGMKIFLVEDLMLRLDARYVIMLDNWLRLVRTPAGIQFSNGRRWNNMEVTGGLSYLLGGKARDADKDGVLNDMDACPDTPPGVTVDTKGCPLDSDGDYVFDGMDQCPGTPVGAWVDSKGCPRDSDGDGILDGLDMCTDTPLGTLVNEDGCPLDSDGDGVFDGLDQCPGTPAGCVVNDVGCPLDADGDGVCDALDRCPGTKVGDKVDAVGCSGAQKGGFVLEGITFKLNSAVIDPKSYPALNNAAQVMRDNPNVKVEIGGYTDSSGSAAYNKNLSLKRAEAVKSYLVDKGISAAQMTAVGYGEAKPIASNKTAEGRAQNRRIEFRFLTEGLGLLGVNFKSGSAAIDPSSYPELVDIAATMLIRPGMTVEIGGHTDSKGAAAMNRKLSLKRAEAVKKYLVGKGVQASQLKAKGYGEAQPIASNKTEKGRAQNRRIELKVLVP